MDLIQDLISLFNINKARKKWDHSLEDEATFNFINKVSSDPAFINIMDYELAAIFLPDLFRNLKFPLKEHIGDEEAKNFLATLNECLSSNMSDYWIVVPLIGAKATNSIQIDNELSILAGTRKDKLTELSQMMGLEFSEIESRFIHTERSRSPHFLDDPLLVIKLNHQRSIVNCYAVEIAYYAINFITILYWGYLSPSSKSKSNWRSMKDIKKYTNKHIAIQAISGNNWTHSPLHFEYNCDFSLDWLNLKKYRALLSDLMNLISLTYEQNQLSIRFLRSIRFFVRGINIQNKNQFFDEESDTILLLNIASECILIRAEREDGISKKIRLRLSKLSKTNNIPLHNRENIIKQMSQLRGNYVHRGIPANIKNSFSSNQATSTALYNYKRIVARFLCDAFKLNEEYKAKAACKGTNIEEEFYTEIEKL